MDFAHDQSVAAIACASPAKKKSDGLISITRIQKVGQVIVLVT
ncbi:hypothetical protein A7A08_00800 [Methyloligella halotolerans]|uniref:Uncharacterized protein n=1 Tax=Methyloligella halotolerans TaxID=1177755 RepID=A0A1E2S370_9HYPH|nr:hypothetical protein A7A08_00800 [Methyloligella halotolerans]